MEHFIDDDTLSFIPDSINKYKVINVSELGKQVKRTLLSFFEPTHTKFLWNDNVSIISAAPSQFFQLVSKGI